MNIDEKQREVAKLREQISIHEKAICDLLIRLAPLEHDLVAHATGIAVGDVIEWGIKPVYRGRVVSSQKWLRNEYKFHVIRVLKSGEDGALKTVRSYDNPRKVTP